MKISYLAAIPLLFLLVACSGAPAQTSTTNNSVSSSAPSQELTQSFVSDDGALTFNYSQGWTVQGSSSQVILSNSHDAIGSGASGPVPGQFFASIIIAPATDTPGLSAGATAMQVLEVFSQFFTADSDPQTGPVFGETTDFTIGERSAARMESLGDDSQSAILVVDLGEDIFAVAIAAAAPGELPNHEPTLRAILGTMQYTAAG